MFHFYFLYSFSSIVQVLYSKSGCYFSVLCSSEVNPSAVRPNTTVACSSSVGLHGIICCLSPRACASSVFVTWCVVHVGRGFLTVALFLLLYYVRIPIWTHLKDVQIVSNTWLLGNLLVVSGQKRAGFWSHFSIMLRCLLSFLTFLFFIFFFILQATIVFLESF